MPNARYSFFSEYISVLSVSLVRCALLSLLLMIMRYIAVEKWASSCKVWWQHKRMEGQALNEVRDLKRMSYRERMELEGHSGKSQGSDRACTQGWHYTRLFIVFTINKQFLCFIREEKLKRYKFLIVVELKYNL